MKRRPPISILIIFACLSLNLGGATLYVDSAANGTDDGSSWANAFPSLGAIKASPGDTVYISGGASGQSRTYAAPPAGYWNPPSGTSSAWISYRIATDSSHNGTAIFTAGAAQFISGPRYVTVSGLSPDGARHFKLSGFAAHSVFSNLDYFHLEGVDGGAGIGDIGSMNGAHQSEVNDCTFNVTDLGADRALYISFLGTVRTDNTIHDCKILIPNKGPGIGADGIQGGGQGFSIHHNRIEGYYAAYTGGQHQDGYQSTGNDNMAAIYGNEFVNISNYSIYGDAYYGGFTDILVYDNIIRYTDQRYSQGTSNGIVFGVDGGYVGGGTCTFTRVIIAHNVVADLKWLSPPNVMAGIVLNNVTSRAAAYIGCEVVDNVMLNDTTTVDSRGNTTTKISNNVALTPAQAVTQFAHYVPFDEANDFRLLSSANLLIAKGIAATGITSDRAGKAFANPPAVGAYEAGGGSPTIPPSGATIKIEIP